MRLVAVAVMPVRVGDVELLVEVVPSSEGSAVIASALAPAVLAAAAAAHQTTG